MNRLSSEPVVTAGAIAGLISAFLVWVRIMGWVTWTQEQFEAFMVFVTLLLPIVGALVARRFVTPLASPRNNAGERLVPDRDYPQ